MASFYAGRLGPVARLAAIRAMWAAATLVLASVMVFCATQLMPGNVAQLILGQFASPEAVAALEAKLGLDRPALVQFGSWASSVLHGDFGTSARMDVPIGPLLAERLGRSLLLAGSSLALVAVAGTAMGTVAALWRGRAVDRVLSTASLIGISLPEFVTGSLLILLFAGTLPVSGYSPPSAGLGTMAVHLLLPVASLTIIMLAHVMRTARVSMIEVLGAPYVRTATLKGLPMRSVIVKHALRNALLPTVTVLGINVGYLIGGLVVVELVFAYPGLGRLAVFAVQNHDIPLIQACTLTMAGIYILASLVADLLYLVLNPRLRGP